MYVLHTKLNPDTSSAVSEKHVRANRIDKCELEAVFVDLSRRAEARGPDAGVGARRTGHSALKLEVSDTSPAGACTC